jgi:hypothetical protein
MRNVSNNRYGCSPANCLRTVGVAAATVVVITGASPLIAGGSICFVVYKIGCLVGRCFNHLRPKG